MESTGDMRPEHVRKTSGATACTAGTGDTDTRAALTWVPADAAAAASTVGTGDMGTRAALNWLNWV